MWFVLAVLGFAIVAGLVVPFAIGFKYGPPVPAGPGSVTGPAPAMRPLGRIAGLYGRFMLLYVVLAALSIKDGYFGGYRRGAVCINTGYPLGTVASLGVNARHGALLSATGTIWACAPHPGFTQWVLYLLTKLPWPALLVCVLLLIWQLITHASVHGPFTGQAAALMWRLGWVVIAGSMIAGALAALGSNVLSTMLITPAPYDSLGIAWNLVLFAPLKALVPVPALAGAALLSFARITRTGAVMDEELKATV
jgi:hypothetical protein